MADSPVGVWSLLSWEIKTEGGEVQYPFGKNPVGTIVLTEDGHMSAHIMAAERDRFIQDAKMAGTTAEKASAFDTYAAYSGRWRIEGNRLCTEVVTSLFPNMVGSIQERNVKFEGQDLLLYTDSSPLISEPSVAYLRWRRQ